MRKTLLLVFIHGFKGGDDTFGTFPEHLRALLSHALPNINVVTATYPKYETRGELQECVAKLRDWLLNKVIDIEVASKTPSPTIDPSVHTILIGHSMGGIVAAETLLSLAYERPLSSHDAAKDAMGADDTTPDNSTTAAGENVKKPAAPVDIEESNFMFPYIRGVLAYDTPFLGLAPEMIAHGLEGGHKFASSAYNTWNEVNSMFGWGGKNTAGGAVNSGAPAGMLPPAAATADVADAAAAPKWQWGKYAMFAGAAGAIAAGGAAALYSQRERISEGWAWAGSHLLFVGDLAKAERLRQRIENVNKECSARGLGAACFYTNLGRGAREGYGITETISSRQRTFCNLPAAVKEGRPQFPDGKSGLLWIKAINDKAKDETNAHVSMFFPKENPGFYALGEASKEVLTSWIDKVWYDHSDGPVSEDHLNDTMNPSSIDKDWEGLDHNVDHDDFHMREEQNATTDDHDMLEGSVIVDKSPTASTTLGQMEKERSTA